MGIKSEYKLFGLFLLFAGIIVILFLFLGTLKLMQKEIMLTVDNQVFLMHKLASPTPTMATPSATMTPTTGVIRSFQAVPKKQ